MYQQASPVTEWGAPGAFTRRCQPVIPQRCLRSAEIRTVVLAEGMSRYSLATRKRVMSRRGERDEERQMGKDTGLARENDGDTVADKGPRGLQESVAGAGLGGTEGGGPPSHRRSQFRLWRLNSPLLVCFPPPLA